jgi:uncharacterized protein YjbI with pentapeptide repeats
MQSIITSMRLAGLARSAVVAALFIILSTYPAAGQSNPKISGTHSWDAQIRAALQKDEPADLAKLSSKASERIIESSFLRELLTGNYPQNHQRRITIRNAVVISDFDLSNEEIPVDVALIDCHFQGGVNFQQANFKKSLTLDGSEFSGEVELLYCRVNGALSARSAKFTKPDKEVSFEGLRVGDDVNFNQAVFAGGASFNSLETGRDFQMNLARFNSANLLVNFESIRARNGLFHKAEFEGPVKFTGAEFSESLEASGVQFRNATGPRFDDVKAGTIIFDTISFRDKYPDRNGVRFEGIKFDRIAVWNNSKNEGERWSNEHLIDIASRAEFSPEFYTGLEAFLNKVGEPEKSEDLFLGYKRRERNERLTGLDKLKSYTLDLLVGYGRKPYKAFIYSAFVLIVGCFVFGSKSGMELQKKEDGKDAGLPIYNPFWYSLDLLAPVIDLKAASVWTPRADRKFARNYVHIQRIFGWILIPIGLVALSGLLSVK